MNRREISFALDNVDKDGFNALLFSETLRTIRHAKRRIGLREAAKQIGISASQLSRLENCGVPSVQAFEKCCHWLGCDMDDFFLREKPKKPICLDCYEMEEKIKVKIAELEASSDAALEKASIEGVEEVASHIFIKDMWVLKTLKELLI